MVKNKILFLLAVTFLLNENGYGIIKENNESIRIPDESTISVSKNNNFVNTSNGSITVTSGKGLYITDGVAKNSGKIVVENGMGANLNNTSGIFRNETNGIIDIKGSTAKGSEIWKGSVQNEGKINVTEAGIGIFVNNKETDSTKKVANFINDQTGSITSNGKDSRG